MDRNLNTRMGIQWGGKDATSPQKSVLKQSRNFKALRFYKVSVMRSGKIYAAIMK